MNTKLGVPEECGEEVDCSSQSMEEKRVQRPIAQDTQPERQQKEQNIAPGYLTQAVE